MCYCTWFPERDGAADVLESVVGERVGRDIDKLAANATSPREAVIGS